MTRPRDSQRSKLFTAEQNLDKHLPAEPDGIFALQKFAQKVVTSSWWQKTYATDISISIQHNGPRTCTAPATHTGFGSTYSYGASSRNRKVHLLHALAHIVADPDEAWHGRDFAKKYLELVERFLGKTPAVVLREQYRDLRITRKTVSDEALINRRIQSAANIWTEFLKKEENND